MPTHPTTDQLGHSPDFLTQRQDELLAYLRRSHPELLSDNQLDLKKLYYQSGGKPEDWNPELYESLMPNYRFDDIPEHMRVKTFLFAHEGWVEEQINARVLLCRQYIQTLLT